MAIFHAKANDCPESILANFENDISVMKKQLCICMFVIFFGGKKNIAFSLISLKK